MTTRDIGASWATRGVVDGVVDAFEAVGAGGGAGPRIVVGEVQVIGTSRHELVDLVLQAGPDVVESRDHGLLLAGGRGIVAVRPTQGVLPVVEHAVVKIARVGEVVAVQRIVDRGTAGRPVDGDGLGGDGRRHGWSTVGRFCGPVPDTRISYGLPEMIYA